MPEAIIRVIWATHRGRSFPDTPRREEQLRKSYGENLQIILCEAPDNPMELYAELTQCVGEVVDRRFHFAGFELGVPDLNLLCWLTLLKQSGALLAPILSPAFKNATRELSLEESLEHNRNEHMTFSGYFMVDRVVPLGAKCS